MFNQPYKENSATNTVTYTNFYANPIFEDYYRKIIELCIENDMAMHIVKLPLPDNGVYTDNYEPQFYDDYNALKNDYPEITVDCFPLYEQKYFMPPHEFSWCTAF